MCGAANGRRVFAIATSTRNYTKKPDKIFGWFGQLPHLELEESAIEVNEGAPTVTLIKHLYVQTECYNRAVGIGAGNSMDVEKTIAEIEWLERIFALPDTRRLRPTDLQAVNRKHDEMYAANPWFRLWKRYGVCTRSQTGSSYPYSGPNLLNCL